MTTLANHIQTLYEAKLYEDVKTLVSIVIAETSNTVMLTSTIGTCRVCDGRKSRGAIH